ncbi:hypothetical protein KZ564_004912, partial [Escherichia coli]|nr:hypothetical protein [Escherichia coli]EIQ6914941.1 hypothetical protein [Escherichia coli]
AGMTGVVWIQGEQSFRYKVIRLKPTTTISKKYGGRLVQTERAAHTSWGLMPLARELT